MAEGGGRVGKCALAHVGAPVVQGGLWEGASEEGIPQGAGRLQRAEKGC